MKEKKKLKNKKQNVKILLKAYILQKQLILSLEEQINILRERKIPLFVLPKHINLLGDNFRILIKKDCGGCLGKINYEDKTIILKADGNILNTLIHECGHYLCYKFNLSKDTEIFSNLYALFTESLILQTNSSNFKSGEEK